MKKKLTIGVIGHTGMVGSEVYNYYKKRRYPTFGLSVNKFNGTKNHSWEEINTNCNIIFVCVPTPYNWKKKKPNQKIVEDVVKKITQGKTVVVKSTIWPGTTERLQEKFPKLYLLFNPEFLSRSSAKKDFEYPDRQLIGYTRRSKNKANLISKILPKGKYNKIIKSEEAELIKYAHNVFGAMRIIYANHLYDVCKKMKLNYDEVKNGFTASELVGAGTLRYMTIFHNKKRGYGGPCFPKDVASYIEFCKKQAIPHEIVEATRIANIRLLKKQRLDEQKVENR